MRIRQELDNVNPKIKIVYYDLGCMHNESNSIQRQKNKEKKKTKFIFMNIHFIQVLMIHMIGIQNLMDLVQNDSSLRPTLSTSGHFQGSQQ